MKINFFNKKVVFIGHSMVKAFPYKEELGFVDKFSEEFNCECINSGINGDTIENVLKRIDTDVLSYEPDYVFILIGTNEIIDDIYNRENNNKYINEIIDIAIQNNVEPIFLTIPEIDIVWAQRRYNKKNDVEYLRNQKEIIELNTDIKNICEKKGIKLVDLYYAFNKYRDLVSGDKSLCDGIHPSRDGYDFISKILINYFK